MAYTESFLTHWNSIPQYMPDIATEAPTEYVGTLDQVGMARIEVMAQIQDFRGRVISVPALVDAFISLDDEKAKGIHMSRVFLALDQILEKEVINYQTIEKILKEFVKTHSQLSQSSFFKIDFDYMIQRKALKSDNVGWRKYPVSLRGEYKNQQVKFEIQFQVVYSSTCPCSAALSRQLIQEDFLKNFSGKELRHQDVLNWLGQPLAATPHSQRSYADVRILLGDSYRPQMIDLIDQVEKALKTPVQAAVKREDEQEFARLNGENLMFCEDAARKLKSLYENDSNIQDYWIRVRHEESLHPHDAVSIVTKNRKV